MISSTTATHLATIPIDWYIAIKSTVHPPSTRDQKACCRLNGYERILYLFRLLQREIHRHRHDDWHRRSVERCRRELPLFDRLERRGVEQRDGAKHLGFLHATIRPD